MGNPSILQALEIEEETNFAENVDTFAGLRLPTIGRIELALVEPNIDSGRTQQTQQGGQQWIRGTQFGSTIKVRIPLPGHGGVTSGAVTISDFEDFLGSLFGASIRSANAGDTATGGTAAAITTTAANGFAAGGLFRLGVLGDGRGEGQWGVVGSHAANSLASLVELPGAPNNGDVVHSAVNLYTLEDPTNTTLRSYRMRFLSGNQRYKTHGCVVVGVALSPWSVGSTPSAEVTLAVARWDEINSGTFPSTLATESALEAAITAGSVFLAPVGTATRANNTYEARDVSIEWTINTALLKGYGGVTRYQELMAARRLPAQIKVSLTIDAEANTATPDFPTLARAGTDLHCLIGGSVSPGSALAAYFPRLCCIGVPTQIDVEGINRFRLEMMAYTGLTSSSALTQAAARLGFA